MLIAEINKAHEKQISPEGVICREEAEVEYEDNRKASATSWHSGDRKNQNPYIHLVKVKSRIPSETAFFLLKRRTREKVKETFR
jgi:hypothetical protein